jgi:hypothetical protein
MYTLGLAMLAAERDDAARRQVVHNHARLVEYVMGCYHWTIS